MPEKRRVKLDKRTLDRLVHDPSEKNKYTTYWDAELRGFGVRVFPTGVKTFVLFYRTKDRRQRVMTLGRYGVLTPVQARELAVVRRTEVLYGKDPHEAKVLARQAGTFAELAATFMERNGSKRRSAAQTKMLVDKYLVPAWGNRTVPSITRKDAANLLHKLGTDNGQVVANRALELARSIFNRGHGWGLVAETLRNPVAGLEFFPERQRERFVTKAEMPRLLAALDAEQDVFVRAIIWAYLLTGSRKSALQRLRWSDVDFENGVLTLREVKGGHDQVLPLSGRLRAILGALPRIHGTPYVFAGRYKGTHISNASARFRQIRSAAGLDDVTLHDLRRTVGSWLAQDGASTLLVGKVLGHASQAATAIYARFDQASVAEALEAQARLLDAAHSPSPDAGSAGSAADVRAAFSSDVDENSREATKSSRAPRR